MPQIKHSLVNQPPDTTFSVDQLGFEPMPLQYEPSTLTTIPKEARIPASDSLVVRGGGSHPWGHGFNSWWGTLKVPGQLQFSGECFSWRG